MSDKLVAFLEKEIDTYTDREHALDVTEAVLDFFIKELEKSEPAAKYELSVLRGAKDYVEAQDR